MSKKQKPAEEDTKDKLKKALNTLGNAILQDVKKILCFLEELNKSGRRSEEQSKIAKEYMPSLKEMEIRISQGRNLYEHIEPFPYLKEIASNITPPKAFYSMLKDIDNYCFTLGIPHIRFIHQAKYYGCDPSKNEDVQVKLDNPQFIVNMVDMEYGESHCNALEVEKIFREEIFNQLTLYNDRIEKEKRELSQPEKVAESGKEGSGNKIIIARDIINSNVMSPGAGTKAKEVVTTNKEQDKTGWIKSYLPFVSPIIEFFKLIISFLKPGG